MKTRILAGVILLLIPQITETIQALIPKLVDFFLRIEAKFYQFLEANPEYGILQLDDREVEYYQTPSGNFYRFDLKLAGRDIDVDVTEDGKVSLAKKLY